MSTGMPEMPTMPMQQDTLPPQIPLYNPNDATQRMQIRSGQADPVGAKRYKRSKSGAYEIARDPNRNVNQGMKDDVRRQGYDYAGRQQGLMDQVGAMDTQQTQTSLESMWQEEKLRQEEEYASYYAEASQYSAEPFRWTRQSGDRGGSNTGGSGWSFKMLETSGIGEIRTKIVNAAVAGVRSGVEYSWGGGGIRGASYGVASNGRDGRNTLGFDCSGLVQYAYGRAGITLPRVSRQQATSGTIVPVGSLRPGDIVGWGSSPRSATHVAVYLGNGYIAEAANEKLDMQIRRLTDREMRGQGAFGVQIYGGA